jgi:alpha-glucosidase/alpha-D-xyloside xylohydrolase
MISSEDAYNKKYFGGVVPIGWMLGNGWALLLANPSGAIDLSGDEGTFTPEVSKPALPEDIFLTGFKDSAEAVSEYARITGFPSMPPVWALGYQQSHRTISSWEMVSTIARTFREKKLPCDVLIYLGTGFAPSGWNTGHRSFTFNPKVFPDPAAEIQALHDMHFKVVLHEMDPPRGLIGKVSDLPGSDPNQVANYWAKHAPIEKLGTDGWWADEGEHLSRESRLARIRMYWDGPRLEQPNVRPYSLNRTGYAGMQSMGGWLWSGDINSTWQTLTDQVPVGINTSMTGVPYWGTDIGGFFSTKELTGELFVRWFEFGAFTPLFRAHGRPSAMRYPWSWSSGDIGEPELNQHVEGSALPDSAELRNPAVEPICRKYLELRYRLMPYLYSAAAEAHETGLPIMRALWLYYRDDPAAATRGDEYLWGRDILVSPVTEKGAVSRTPYLPRGAWYDFWTNEKVEGGKELSRTVDLATIPLFVRAGAIVPMGPLKQYTTEKVSGPLTLTVYPGADGHFTLYDDDGVSFNYEKGQYTRVDLKWDDRARRLTMAPEHESGTWNEISRNLEIRLSTGGAVKRVSLNGKIQHVQF